MLRSNLEAERMDSGQKDIDGHDAALQKQLVQANRKIEELQEMNGLFKQQQQDAIEATASKQKQVSHSMSSSKPGA